MSHKWAVYVVAAVAAADVYLLNDNDFDEELELIIMEMITKLYLMMISMVIEFRR